MSEAKPKKKQKPKKGRVVRVAPEVARFIDSKTKGNETVSSVLARELGLDESAQTYYILPESKIVCDSAAEARGVAVLRAVRRGKKPTEKPLKVRVV